MEHPTCRVMRECHLNFLSFLVVSDADWYHVHCELITNLQFFLLLCSRWDTDTSPLFAECGRHRSSCLGERMPPLKGSHAFTLSKNHRCRAEPVSEELQDIGVLPHGVLPVHNLSGGSYCLCWVQLPQEGAGGEMESDGPDTKEAFFNPYRALYGPVMKGTQGSKFQSSHFYSKLYDLSGNFCSLQKKQCISWVGSTVYCGRNCYSSVEDFL